MIVKTSITTFKGSDWCVPHRCPCLTCELWNSAHLEPDCACRPCNQKGLRAPENVVCWKTCDELKAFDRKTQRVIASRKKMEESKR